MDDDKFVEYNIPASTGFIISVNNRDKAPIVKELVGKVGSQSIPSYDHVKVGQKLQVRKNQSSDEPISMFYIDLDVAVSSMSENFKEGIRFAIAYEISFKHIQSARIRESFRLQSLRAFSAAKVHALENLARNTFVKINSDKAYINVDTDGQSYTPESDETNRILLEGIRKGPYAGRKS